MVFRSNEFKKTVLSNDSGSIEVSLKGTTQGTFLDSLLKNDSNLFVTGYLTDPLIKPEWLKPGVNLQGIIDGYEANFKMLATIQNRVVGIEEITGTKVKFEVTIVSKFVDV